MTAVLQALGRGPRALLFSAHDLQRLVIAQIIKKSKFIHLGISADRPFVQPKIAVERVEIC